MTISSESLRAISVPKSVETRIGTLEYVDGVPSPRPTTALYDHLDFVHALNAYLDGFAGASTVAMRRGFLEAGVSGQPILIFSELMDARSLFLTANCDTVYFLGIVDLTSGPMVVETPPQALALFDDMWFDWIVDFGLPGPIAERAAGSCSYRRATTAPCPTAATTSDTRRRRGCSCSVARSWTT